MATNNVNDEDVIPSWKIKKAYEICMKDPKLAKYFNDAPAGARQYIALEFYCTVFSREVNDNLCAKYQQEVEEDLAREDVWYLAENDPNSASKTHFRKLYVEMSKKVENGDRDKQDGVDENTMSDDKVAVCRRETDKKKSEEGNTKIIWNSFFSNPHDKIKALACIVFGLGALILVLSMLIALGLVVANVGFVLIVIFYGVPAALFLWFFCLFLYTWGQLVEDVAAIRKRLEA